VPRDGEYAVNQSSNTTSGRDIASLIHPCTNLNEHRTDGAFVIKRGDGVLFSLHCEPDGQFVLSATDDDYVVHLLAANAVDRGDPLAVWILKPEQARRVRGGPGLQAQR
jgi:hypothetical protein